MAFCSGITATTSDFSAAGREIDPGKEIQVRKDWFYMNKSPVIKTPMRFAHRGLVQYAPENTIPAYQAAIDYGCEGIEMDIRLSKDGEVIVVHDSHFRRMTRGLLDKNIADMTAEEILAVDLPYAGHLLPYDPPMPYSESESSARTYTDEQVEEFKKADQRVTHLVTFEQFDKWFETIPNDVTIEIEFCTQGLVVRMMEILRQSKNCSRYIIFSGHESVNREIQTYIRMHGKPEGLRVGANLRRLNDKYMEFIRNSDLYEVGLNDFWFTQEDVEALRKMGVLVFSNLGDYPEWWQKVNEWGIAGFKTNYAEAYTDWRVKNPEI